MKKKKGRSFPNTKSNSTDIMIDQQSEYIKLRGKSVVY